MGVRKYNPDIVKGVIEFAEQNSHTDFAVHGSISTRGQDNIVKVVPELIRMGAISFKMLMTWNPWNWDSKTNLVAVPDELLMRIID